MAYVTDSTRTRLSGSAKRFLPFALTLAFAIVVFAIFNRPTPTVTLSAVQSVANGMVRWSGVSTYSNDCTYMEFMDIEQGRLVQVDQPLPPGPFDVETGPYDYKGVAWLHIRCSGRLQQQFVWPIPDNADEITVDRVADDETVDVVRVQVDLSEHIKTLNAVASDAIPSNTKWGRDIRVLGSDWTFRDNRIIYRATLTFRVSVPLFPDCRGVRLPIRFVLSARINNGQLALRRENAMFDDGDIQLPDACFVIHWFFGDDDVAEFHNRVDRKIRSVQRAVNPFYDTVMANFTRDPRLQLYLKDQAERRNLVVGGILRDGVATLTLRANPASRIGKGVRPISTNRHGESTIDVSYPLVANLLTVLLEKVDFRAPFPGGSTGIGDQLVTAMIDAIHSIGSVAGYELDNQLQFSRPLTIAPHSSGGMYFALRGPPMLVSIGDGSTQRAGFWVSAVHRLTWPMNDAEWEYFKHHVAVAPVEGEGWAEAMLPSTVLALMSSDAVTEWETDLRKWRLDELAVPRSRDLFVFRVLDLFHNLDAQQFTVELEGLR